MISLEKLLEKFNPLDNVEYNGNKFLTNVKSIAPKAYLNIIFGAPSNETREHVINPLRLPKQLNEFYYNYNGALLLSASINIYGFLPEKYVFNRDDWKERPPNNLLKLNMNEIRHLALSPVLLIGSYKPDRSLIGIDKTDGKVYCFVQSDLNQIRATWNSYEDWLVEEIRRISEYFDVSGNQLVEDDKILPI